MASYGHSMPATAPRPGQPVAYGAPVPVGPVSTAPAGTFVPGTKIQVGSHKVIIQKYLSEGGFAHVYMVKMPKPIDGTDLAVLKRVAVPDKEALRGMRIEVETMKRLKGHRPIVTYFDSHASELRGGGYEVFLLMEYCNGGGLIDFMNTRLQHRLTEPEILHIFSDVAEGVACMHYLKPPLLHRDLKVENVLILTTGSKKRFKLCDFGSAAAPRAAPQTVVECRLMDEDVQKHTTLQYRSPEMVDVYRKQPIDEKSDIWALGVLLYKLCYYTTPFEDQGQLAILNASYRFPSYPVFSDKLKKLIASMLRENQQSRPNIYQVLRDSCSMQGREVPVQDIYAGRSQSEPRSGERAPATDKDKSTPVVGAVFAPPPQQQQAIPEIVPMRRGRPTVTSQQPPHGHKPSPSPLRVLNGDPFAALDSKAVGKGDADELSSRFPTLDQFSLLHDHGSKFDFDTPNSAPSQPQRDLSQRISEKLADDAFATVQPSPPKTSDMARPRTVAQPAAPTPALQTVTSPPLGHVLTKTASAPTKPSEMSRAQAIITKNPELQAISSQSSQKYVSTGTMTSTPPPAEQPPRAIPIYRFPPSDHQRSTSLPRQPDAPLPGRTWPEESRSGSNPKVPSLQPQPAHTRHPSSSRPSLEGARPNADMLDPSQQMTSSNRPRPVSTHLESNMDYLREKQRTSKPLISPGHPSPKFFEKAPSPALEPEDETNIESNVEFLRSLEESDPKKKDKGSKHGKRSSLTALSGTKNILAGRFGDAFKRFEGNNPSNPGPPRTPSPLKDLDRRDLTPIAGSEATDGRSDDGQSLEDIDNMTPEMRREVERRRLIEEERRVEAAQAEYRQRLADKELNQTTGLTPLPKSIGGVSRAVSIQNRVQNLLSEGQKTSTVQRTAQGYGQYSDAATAATRLEKQLPDIPRKPVSSNMPRPIPTTGPADMVVNKVRPTASDPTISAARPILGAKPVAPRKPMHLNSLPTGGRSGSPPKPQLPSSSDQLGGAGLPGRSTVDMTAKEKDDYIRDFAKRFPSLSAIEMVERDLDEPRK